MKQILITGSNGQLGNEIKHLAGSFAGMEFIFTDLNELDISNTDDLKNFFKNKHIDFLINCAAYTAVDKAESEPEKAFLINAFAPALLAECAVEYGYTLVHISTDYVFDGKSYKPYVDSDPANATSVYGKSKFEGEQAILKSKANALIIRTSWMYSIYGHNFVKTILRLVGEKQELKVVSDQAGSPTYAADLAKTILQIIEYDSVTGTKIYHYSNEGICSWYDFANAIVKIAGLNCKILPVKTSDFPTAAARPHYSVMDKSAIKRDFNLEIPWWYDSLKVCIELLKQVKD